MTTRNWSSGLDNYRNHTVEFLADKTIFTTELLEVPRQFNTISDAFNAHLDGVNLPAEVLYSGGLDSECVLLHCLRNSIPVVAVTMRLLVLGRPINVHDLYYAERFCREHSIKHRIIDLDVDKFFNNGDHIPLVEPYRFTRFTAGAMLWLIKQCESFPVIGGDWTWPQVNMGRPIYSPHRYDYSAMELFMADNGIQGIGNMLSHSLDSNAMFIKEHINVYEELQSKEYYSWLGSSIPKTMIMDNLGFHLELRHRSFGWELSGEFKSWCDVDAISTDLTSRYGETTSIIKWNQTLANLVGGEPGINDSFGI